MALAPRRRGGRRPRWLLIAALASVVVLLINAAISRSDGPAQRIDLLSYVDRMRAQIDHSTAQGGAIAQVRTDAIELGRAGANRLLGRAAREADDVLGAVRAAKAPPSASTAHSILLATMAIRARVAAALAAGIDGVFTDGPLEPAVEALANAGEELQAADRTYEVYLDALPRPAGVTASLLPASAWAAEDQSWGRAEVAAFAGAIRNSGVPSAVHDVGVLTVATDPVAVATEGTAAVLPLVRTLRLEIVVANAGNAAEKQVPVVATLTGPAGEVDTARDFVDLAPGQSRAVPLGGLRPVPGGPSALTVVIGPVEGEGAVVDNQQSMGLLLRG